MLTNILASALQEPHDIAKGVHDVRHRGATWLRNLRIGRVSIVGKGANRKVFTIVKSLDGDTTDVFHRLERALTDWLAARCSRETPQEVGPNNRARAR